MANFDEDIKRITDEILSDGTVDQIIREKVTDGIEKAIASSFNYEKLEKAVKERVEQVLVPFIESYDMSGYIVKLDTLLTEMVNKSVLTDNKNLLENFKFMMEEPQETDIKISDLMDLAESPKVAIKSGQGVGKTGMEAVALLWFLCCYPYPRIVATAPTKQQLHDVLWSEVSKWMSKSPLLSDILKWTKTYIYMVGNEKRWFAVARTATKPENMQGFHEDNMLFIVDEASGVADPIMEAILGTLSGANNKLLMCGNPTRTSGTFYDAFNVDRSIYRCHTVSSADSKRTNKQNIESLIRKYGKDSNVVLVRVFGEFPKQEDDVFIALSIVEHCCMLDLPDDVPIKRISFGVDVARYGSDETVIAKNVGGRITLPVSFRGQSLMTTVGKIVQLYRQAITEFPRYRGKIYINIDDCGLGGGVTDRLEEVKQEEKLTRMVIVPVNAAGKVPEETLGDGKQKACDIYDNMTTYLWGTVKDALMMEEVSLENDNELVAQFTCRKYRLTSRGKMLLESKEEMKKRGIDSPDRADAVALSCYQKKTFNIGSLVD